MGEIKLSLPHRLHAMLCCCLNYLKKTTSTPTLNGGRGGLWIVLFSEVTPFKDNVLIILSRVVVILVVGRLRLDYFNYWPKKVQIVLLWCSFCLFEIFISCNRQCITRLLWELRCWLGNSKTWIFLCWPMILIMDKKQSMLWNDSTVIGTRFSYIKSIRKINSNLKRS